MTLTRRVIGGNNVVVPHQLSSSLDRGQIE